MTRTIITCDRCSIDAARANVRKQIDLRGLGFGDAPDLCEDCFLALRAIVREYLNEGRRATTKGDDA